jgi:predicted AAA+ superfamily ATPase
MEPPICSAAKLGSALDFRLALEIGLIPLSWQAADPQASLAAYASLYLQEEVQAEVLAREAEIPRKRAESYLSILEDLLLCFQLPVFQRPSQRQLVQHQKFFFFDVCVFCSLRPRGPLDAPQEIE